MLLPLPLPPAPGVVEPEGDMAKVAVSEFAGSPGLLPGCGDTTTPALDEAGPFPVPTPPDELWVDLEGKSGGGSTETLEVISPRPGCKDAISAGGAATAALPRPLTACGCTFRRSTGGGATAALPRPRAVRPCMFWISTGGGTTVCPPLKAAAVVGRTVDRSTGGATTRGLRSLFKRRD